MQDTIHKVLLALHRLQKVTKGTTPGSIQSIVLQLTPDGFAFCHKGGVDEGSQTWSHFQAAKLFQDYRIESKRSNKISLEAQIPNLLHVFSSCANSDITTLRLANGQDGRPVLHFDFSLAGNATDHKVGQEVPVRVIPEAEAEGIREPEMPEPEFQIELPGSVAKLRNVLDRMKQVGATLVAVEASKEAGADLPGLPPWPAEVFPQVVVLKICLCKPLPAHNPHFLPSPAAAPDVSNPLDRSSKTVFEATVPFTQVFSSKWTVFFCRAFSLYGSRRHCLRMAAISLL